VEIQLSSITCWISCLFSLTCVFSTFVENQTLWSCGILSGSSMHSIDLCV
jgi:hypothetical protein